MNSEFSLSKFHPSYLVPFTLCKLLNKSPFTRFINHSVKIRLWSAMTRAAIKIKEVSIMAENIATIKNQTCKDQQSHHRLQRQTLFWLRSITPDWHRKWKVFWPWDQEQTPNQRNAWIDCYWRIWMWLVFGFLTGAGGKWHQEYT